MDMRRFTLEDMSNTIDAIMENGAWSDKMKHDVLRAIEHAWAGRGTLGSN